MDNVIKGKIETPKEGDQLNQLPALAGWAFSNVGKPVKVEIFFDDELIYETRTGMPRYDIEQEFPNFIGSYKSGFLGKIWLAKFENGIHNLHFIAKSDGIEKSLGNFKVNLRKDSSLLVNASHDSVLNQGYALGYKTIRHFIEKCEIKSYHKILEVGCQYGRLSLPFADFLKKGGSFDGLEILPEAVRYCQSNITPKFPNFHFSQADVYNKYYNPVGKNRASEFEFLFNNETFDFVFLISVFTHMMPDDVKNYLKQISRILKKNGKCLISYYLLNTDSLSWIKSNKTNRRRFDYQNGVYRTVNKENPEALIAYDELWVRKLYQDNQLKIKNPILYGSWSGKDNQPMPQDIIIANKE